MYSVLKILCKDTVLKEFQIVSLDSGRYSTPTPTWGFIHDPKYRSESIYAYKYILKDSIDYVIQQFLYNDDNEEERIAKDGFDEVVLYFENKNEQEEFHSLIENNPELVDVYMEDSKLGHYHVSSSNKLEVKDATNKLITAFAFNRFFFDYRRKKQGVDVKRINSVKIENEIMGLISSEDISKHKIDIHESGSVHHSLYNKNNRIAIEKYNYSVDKYWMREFLNFLEPITTTWTGNYSVDICDGNEWRLTIKYSDGTKKITKGNIIPNPDGEEVERRIRVLANFEKYPSIF